MQGLSAAERGGDAGSSLSPGEQPSGRSLLSDVLRDMAQSSSSTLSSSTSSPASPSPFSRARYAASVLERFDLEYMRPMFGGPPVGGMSHSPSPSLHRLSTGSSSAMHAASYRGEVEEVCSVPRTP
jgi:hypothetical protein